MMSMGRLTILFCLLLHVLRIFHNKWLFLKDCSGSLKLLSTSTLHSSHSKPNPPEGRWVVRNHTWGIVMEKSSRQISKILSPFQRIYFWWKMISSILHMLNWRLPVPGGVENARLQSGRRIRADTNSRKRVGRKAKKQGLEIEPLPSLLHPLIHSKMHVKSTYKVSEPGDEKMKGGVQWGRKALKQRHKSIQFCHQGTQEVQWVRRRPFKFAWRDQRNALI